MAQELPTGYSIVRHPRSKLKFVLTPNNRLVPNQGTRQNLGRDEPDEEVIADFLIWFAKNE